MKWLSGNHTEPGNRRSSSGWIARYVDAVPAISSIHFLHSLKPDNVLSTAPSPIA
jgi:hypothetical protein